MKQFISLLIFATLALTSTAFAAKKPVQKSTRKTSSVSQKQKSQKNSKKWNEICQGLLDSSVKSTLKLEKSVQKKKKISKEEFENRIHNELMVVQLNAWVCSISIKNNLGAAAEEVFLQDYSKLVQSKKL